ncbi:H-NS histone family protein [Hydrogenophaga sp.]|uniref:H-NS histone family protein n=1 Tax=Hydrogenophaga sp. TaxID=1904254 RepID=UPI0025BB5FB8|nr:H-NS histone family protein [Hydrogenophaga sp.]
MAQAQALIAQAEQARKDELSAVIADIKAKMKEYGIKVADLGSANASAGVRKGAKSKAVLPAKFRGPSGELWAGGPGRKPEWVRDALAAGRSLDEFRI